MPTQRFEGTTLDEAVQAAVRQAGPTAKIVGANRVRKGGIGGFFAREHVEVEIEVEVPTAKPAPPPNAGRRRARAPQAGRGTASAGAPAGGATVSPGPELDDDPLTSLIEEMATSGPSSILDLAEEVSTEERHFSLAPTGLEHAATAADWPEAVKPGGGSGGSEDFAAVLARIAQESGLLDGPPEASPPAPAPARPAPARPTPARPAPVPATLAPPALAAPAAAPPVRHKPQNLPAQHEASNFGRALRQLGLPLQACQEVGPAATRESLQDELARTLRACLPSLPETPSAPSSVVAVVGPKGQVMAAAKALAREMGAKPDEIALATRRKVWRQQDHVIATAEAAAEERRSWRWRAQPSVVAIEHEVRPGDAAWAVQMLQALQPTLCWGVASAAHKPEDIAAWSGSLGGLDAIALTDLSGTTTPAAALAAPVPVGRLDGQPATPEAWAQVLCDRLLG